MSLVRKLLNLIFCVGVLAAVTYCGYGFTTAGQRVAALCSEITPGLSFTELNQFAATHGLSQAMQDSGVHTLVERRSFGHYGCQVTLESGKVIHSELEFAN